MDLKQYANTLLKSTVQDANTTGGTLYVVPTDMSCYTMALAIHNPSGSLAGTTDVDVTNWRTDLDLSDMITTNSYKVFDSNNAMYTITTGGTNIDVIFNSGTTQSITVTFDLFGYLG